MRTEPVTDVKSDSFPYFVTAAATIGEWRDADPNQNRCVACGVALGFLSIAGVIESVGYVAKGVLLWPYAEYGDTREKCFYNAVYGIGFSILSVTALQIDNIFEDKINI